MAHQDRDKLKKVFDFLDKDHNGSLDAKELANALRALGSNPTDADIKQLMHEADSHANPNGKIEFNEFCALMAAHGKSLEDEQESMRKAFKAFDRSGDGRIDKNELRTALTSMGLGQLSKAEVDELFDQADKDDNGYIDYHELVAVLTSCHDDD